MKGWTLETAYQDIFGVMPVTIIPYYLASLRKHSKSRGLSFDTVAKNLVYIPKQFLHMDDPTEHLARLWHHDMDQVHLLMNRLVAWREAQSYCSETAHLGTDPSS